MISKDSLAIEECSNEVDKQNEKINDNGTECKVEKENDSLQMQTCFKVENSMSAAEELLKNNHCYNLDYPSYINQNAYINLYLKINMINRLAYSNMLYDHFMKARLPFLNSFNGFN